MMMGGAHASRPHCGWPEASNAKHCRVLLERGYRIGRVEQVETPRQMAASNAGKGKGSTRKVVERALCEIMTSSTVCDPELTSSTESSWLLSMCESKDGVTGVCLADASTGKLAMSAFRDDEMSSALRLLLSRFRPDELALPVSEPTDSQFGIRAKTRRVLSEYEAPPLNAGTEPLNTHYTDLHSDEICDAQRTLKLISTSHYFSDDVFDRTEPTNSFQLDPNAIGL